MQPSRARKSKGLQKSALQRCFEDISGWSMSMANYGKLWFDGTLQETW